MPTHKKRSNRFDFRASTYSYLIDATEITSCFHFLGGLSSWPTKWLFTTQMRSRTGTDVLAESLEDGGAACPGEAGPAGIHMESRRQFAFSHDSPRWRLATDFVWRDHWTIVSRHFSTPYSTVPCLTVKKPDGCLEHADNKVITLW